MEEDSNLRTKTRPLALAEAGVEDEDSTGMKVPSPGIMVRSSSGWSAGTLRSRQQKWRRSTNGQ